MVTCCWLVRALVRIARTVLKPSWALVDDLLASKEALVRTKRGHCWPSAWVSVGDLLAVEEPPPGQ